MNKQKQSILFLAPYPKGIGPAQRFRFEQYLDYLSGDYRCEEKTFWDAKAWSILFQEGKSLAKLYFLLRAFLFRFIMLFSIPKYDLIFIQREVTHIGPPVFEWIIAKVFKKKIIYDFDDAIWRLNYSQKNPIVKYFKAPWKVAKICKWSSMVSCGNAYLADYAQQFNSNVALIPTTIDTDYHLKKRIPKSNKIVLGWTGTLTTLKHIDLILPVLQKLEKSFDFDFLVIANDKPKLELKSLVYKAWNKESEIEDLSQIDIGLMPLPNDEWEKGKCGFKGLQYMATSIPTIMSPVGVNTEIINDQENGLLAETESEWLTAIQSLMSSAELRVKYGEAGRETIIDKYSVKANQEKYLSMIKAVLNEK